MPIRPRLRPHTYGFISTLVLLLLPPAAGAASTASLHGTVVDPDNRPVADALVFVTRAAGGTTAETRTGSQGEFRIEHLAPGRYELRVSLEGFRAEPVRVAIDAGEARRVELRLRVSAVSEALIVSAAQVDAPLSRTPDSVTVLGGRELAARGITTAADALRLVPGMTVARSGGPGAITAVFPRGGESDFTLVLVDGIRLNAFGGSYDFAHLPLAGIERIEVVRGPQSALFGSDAIGGVVQIVTRHGGPARGDATLETGSLETHRLSAGAAGSHGGWSWGGAAERFVSGGWSGPPPGGGEPVTNDDYELRQATGSLGWRSARTQVRGDARIAANERGFPGPFGGDPGGTFPGIDTISRGRSDTRAFSLGVTRSWTPRVRHRSQITFGDLEGDFVSPFGRSESGTRRVSGRTQADLTLAEGLGATTGVEVTGERAHSTFITGETFEPVPVRRRVAGWFGELRSATLDRLYAAAGLRIEHVRRERLEGDPNPFAPRPPFGPERVVSVNPKVSLSWFLQPPAARAAGWTRLRFAAGTGFRPPDAFEIAFTDNPHLRPERSRSIEAGVERALAGGGVLLEATAFHNRYEDLIVTVGQSLRDASRYRSDNISNARAAGLEAAVALRTAWGLDARGTWTWLDTAVLSVDRLAGQAPPPFRVGDGLPRRPRHQGSIDLLVTQGRFSGHGRVGARSRTLDVDPSFGAFGGLFHAPGYAVADAGLAVRLHPRATLSLRASNLFDRFYEDVLGFPAYGRTFTAGVRLAAGR